MKRVWRYLVKIWSIIGDRWCFDCHRRMHLWGFSPGAASREYFCECENRAEDLF